MSEIDEKKNKIEDLDERLEELENKMLSEVGLN